MMMMKKMMPTELCALQFNVMFTCIFMLREWVFIYLNIKEYISYLVCAWHYSTHLLFYI